MAAIAKGRADLSDALASARSTLWRAGIRPGARPRELLLLGFAAVTLLVGWVSLESFRAGRLATGDLGPLVAYFALLLVVHLAFVVSGRRMDQILLPVTGMLGGLSLLLMSRLPQDLVVQTIGGTRFQLAELQLLWLFIGFVLLGALAVLVRQDGWLRYYKYTWAAAGIVLLLLVFVLGQEVNGARLSVTIGPFTGQPSELLKVILVVFLAAYLADNRALLARQNTRIWRLNVPPLPYLLPMLAMWGIALAIVIVQSDLGAALLLFAVFLTLLYVATRRFSYVVLGTVLFLVGAFVLYQLFGHVRTRVDVWLDPYADPLGRRLPDHQGAVRLRARRHRGHRPRGRAAAGGQGRGDPGDPHRLRVHRPGGGARNAGRASPSAACTW